MFGNADAAVERAFEARFRHEKKYPSVLAWHFLRKGKLRNGETPPRNGRWLRYDGEIYICNSGLHASVNPLDAAHLGPTHSESPVTVCRVECRDIVNYHTNKFVCARRKILWRYDAKRVLERFTRRVALDVLDRWDTSMSKAKRRIIEECLKTGRRTVEARNIMLYESLNCGSRNTSAFSIIKSIVIRQLEDFDRIGSVTSVIQYKCTAEEHHRYSKMLHEMLMREHRRRAKKPAGS